MKHSDFSINQSIEVTRVPGTVAIHNKIRSALSASGTGNGSITKQYVHIVFKKPHAMAVSGNPVLVPQVKHTAQELTVCVQCGGPWLATAFMTNGIQTDDKLNVAESQLIC